MDYTYFGGPPQHPTYHYMGMPPAVQIPRSAIDRETTGSVEPLESAFIPSSYDAFSFHPVATTTASPDPTFQITQMNLGSVDSGIGGDVEDQANRARSSSEEKETGLTPAQSRRKAQNRAAQRAFRERKERHVRELEAKLSALESSAQNLQSDNERLKLALQRAKTENEILRATGGHRARSPAASLSATYPSPGSYLSDEKSSGEEENYNVQSMDHGTVMNKADHTHAQPITGRAVPPSQTWDLIQSHPLVKQGLVDVADVCERLKGKATCSGHGPVYEEAVIWKAVEESRRSGGDELI